MGSRVSALSRLMGLFEELRSLREALLDAFASAETPELHTLPVHPLCRQQPLQAKGADRPPGGS